MQVTESARVFRYYGGWADKIQGKTIEVRPENCTRKQVY
jgi:hypothetical protein